MLQPPHLQPRTNAPAPDLRIVPVDSLLPHETHDDQRSLPLIENLRQAEVMINPPVVAPLEDTHGEEQFVILDGANRCHTFRHLDYPHILVQVVAYDSGYVELDTWRHVVSRWNKTALLDALHQLNGVEIHAGAEGHAVAHFVLPDQQIIALGAPLEITHERNTLLRDVVGIYQQNAVLNRTAMQEPDEIWPLYPEAVALVIFPHYEPSDILAAARHHAYLPPGVSRHIIHGRALRVNYPMALLREQETSLESKNAALQGWIQDKIARRQVRYYAEATYQFDE
ncbi:MAG: hypothetical protein SF029_20800 [bacterium]|nr:hypothetical protein [bacterium]